MDLGVERKNHLYQRPLSLLELYHWLHATTDYNTLHVVRFCLSYNLCYVGPIRLTSR
jgi:hypothetical protein